MKFSFMLSLIGLGLGLLFDQNPNQYYYFIAQCVVVPLSIYVFYKEAKVYLNERQQK